MVGRLLAFAIVPLILHAQPAGISFEREVGLPFFRFYSPREYGGQANNWAVTQDPRGVIYVGNNDGVLVYDGAQWRLVRVSNRSAVRSLDVGPDGTVYVGARGDFGYLAPDAAGSLRYISLLDRVPVTDKEFKDVYQIAATPLGVFFSSGDHLFRWKSDAGLKVWRPARRSYVAFRVGDTVVVYHSGEGLMKLEGDSWKPLPGSDGLADSRPYCLSTHGGALLAGFTVEGMFLQDGDTFKPFPTEMESLLREAQPYSCTALKDGGLAIATIRGGVIVINKDGKLLRHLDTVSGLSSNFVTAAYSDREGGLWLALNAGVARVQVPGPLSFFDERAGLTGSVEVIARHDGSLYAGTTGGLFRLSPTRTAELASFEAVEGMDRAVWSLLSAGPDLLVGSSAGIFEWKAQKFRRIAGDKPVYDLTRSRRDPDLVYACARDGLALIRRRGDAWSDGGKAPGVTQALRKLVETPSELWIGTDFEGLLRVQGDLESPSVTAFGTRDGLPTGWVYPAQAGGRVVFLSENGILKFDESSHRFVADPLLTPFFAGTADKPSILVEDQQGNLWAGAKTYGGVLRRQPDGNYHWDLNPLKRMITAEINAAHIDPDGVVWAGTADGVVRYNPAVPKDYQAPFSALVRRVNSIDGKNRYFDGFGAAIPPKLPYANNSLRFEFAAPSFEDESRTEYRVYLQDFDPTWSSWTQETRKDYTNIPEGNYTFRLEARNLYGQSAVEGTYSMTVLAPWYRSWWGYGLRLLALAVLAWLLIHWRLRVLAEQNRRLQHTVDERTAELRQNNVKLTEMNGRLNELNQEKNEFLGIVAHDLKNPLGAVRGYAEMLEEDAGDFSQDEVSDTATRIKKSANLMFDLVSNLLDINRIEQGKLEVSLGPCNLWETVRQTVENYRQRAEAKQINIHFDEKTAAPLALADASELTQIMDNLVSNALKYSPPGKNIYTRVQEAGGCVRAEVRDEGPGLSAEDQTRLFGKFVRLSAKPTAGEHSTGLGLAIVKRLVESMHGRVWCESKLGAGATFFVELPTTTVAEPSASPK